MASFGRKILSPRHGNHGQQQPPKPPRSAFMCFSDSKKMEILQQHNIAQDSDEFLKLVAEAWRHLNDRERADWDEAARNDKVRFVREKAEYTGPMDLKKRRAKKHPLAPKRPMSAFLKYSQTRRSVVKQENPDMSNTDVSRLLGEMWRNSSTAERAPYVEQEERERADYKERIKKWREEQATLDAASRTSHHAVSAAAAAAKPKAEPVAEYRPRTYARPMIRDGGGLYETTDFEPLRIQSVEDAVGKVDERMFRPRNVPPAYHPAFLPPPYRPVAKPRRSDGRPLLPSSLNLHQKVGGGPQPKNSSTVEAEAPTSQAPPPVAARRQPPPPPPPSNQGAPRYTGRSVYFSDSTPSFNYYQLP